MKWRSFLAALPYAVKKPIGTALLLPPFRWLIPEHMSFMMEVQRMMERSPELGWQEFEHRLATDPDLARQVIEHLQKEQLERCQAMPGARVRVRTTNAGQILVRIDERWPSQKE